MYPRPCFLLARRLHLKEFISIHKAAERSPYSVNDYLLELSLKVRERLEARGGESKKRDEQNEED